MSGERVKPVLPSHWNGIGKYDYAFGFEPGTLTVQAGGYGDRDGDSYFVFRDDDLDFEQDDGPLYRIAKVPNSELIELRDHLNKLFPLSTLQEPGNGEARREAAIKAVLAWSDRVGHFLGIGDYPSKNAGDLVDAVLAALPSDGMTIPDKLRELSEKATAGPWQADDDDGEFFGIFDENGGPLGYLAERSQAGGWITLPARPGANEDLDPDPEAERAEHEANALLIVAAVNFVRQALSGGEDRG